jgi:hypothetical protein
MKTNSIQHISAAVIAAGAMNIASAGDTYVAPTISLAAVCAATSNKSGIIIKGTDACEISTDGGLTWWELGAWLSGTLLLWGIATGAVMLRNKWKKEKEETEAEKQARIAEITALETSNPELYATYKDAQELIIKTFPEISVESSYNNDGKRIDNRFSYNKKDTNIVVLEADQVVVFHGNRWYNSNGSWNDSNTWTRFQISHLKVVLESIKNGDENPPAFQESKSNTTGNLSESLETPTDGDDIIAVADTYLAYGRDSQAIDTLEQALSVTSVDDQRMTIELKLMEIYAKDITQNRDKFDAAYANICLTSNLLGDIYDRATQIQDAQASLTAQWGTDGWVNTDKSASRGSHGSISSFDDLTFNSPTHALDDQIAKLQQVINAEDTTPEERWSAILGLIAILSQDPDTLDDEKAANITAQIVYLDTCLANSQAELSEEEKVPYKQLLDVALGNNSFSDAQKEDIRVIRNSMNQ